MSGRTYRIAIFSDSALPVLNGVSVSIDMLVRELRQEGHSVALFTASHFRYRDTDPNTYRFPAVQTPWTRGYPLAIPPFYPMFRRFRRQCFDVIHTHTPFTIGFAGLRWGQSEGIPVVSTYHTLYDKYHHYIPFFPKRYLRYKIAKHTNYYFNAVARITTPSEAAKRWLLRHSVARPIDVIPSAPLPPKPIDRAEARNELGMPAGNKVMLYVGRIAREKNMATLFQAAAQVMREDHATVLWLVGDGPYRGECVALTRELGIGDRVRFVGGVQRDAVDAYYAAADIFVFASMTETQGLVVGEAMQYGLPAVVVGGGGASATVVEGETGFVVRNDAEQMAGSILDVLRSDETHARFCDAARMHGRAYTPRDMARAMVEVYDRALERVDDPIVSAVARV